MEPLYTSKSFSNIIISIISVILIIIIIIIIISYLMLTFPNFTSELL